ncbi:uncharacterized protein [Nicotiana tomentosiformis]|uniref:uncharacterized protein n=1 Tax=Nicotiana tomentosiformis TaxID=4098 RepID=UPI00388CEA4B
MLRKDVVMSWTEECQKAFDKIKEYLSKPPVLVLPEPRRPLLLYLSVLDGSFGCILGQHDETGRKEHMIYYLSKTFTPYEARFRKIKFKHVPRIQNEFADALATLSSMIQYPDNNFIDPIPIEIHKQPAYCAHVEEEFDGNPWFHDIKEYLEKGEYPENATHTHKRTLRRLANHFFQSGGILYRRTLDLGLLRCVDAKEASRFIKEIHAGTCVHADMIHVPPNELNATSSPWPFSTWDMDVIGPIESAASNGHSDLMKAMCETFKIKHQNSTAYRPQMNGSMEAANKNIKKILRNMVDNYKQWHEKLPFALLRYRTTVRTSTVATPYLLVYGTEVVIPAEVEIPSLRIIQEAELSDAEWIWSR